MDSLTEMGGNGPKSPSAILCSEKGARMLVIFLLTALTRAVVDVPTVRLVNGVAPGSVVLMPVMAGGTGEPC